MTARCCPATSHSPKLGFWQSRARVKVKVKAEKLNLCSAGQLIVRVRYYEVPAVVIAVFSSVRQVIPQLMTKG